MQSIATIEEHDPAVLMAYLLSDNDINTIKRELNELKYTVDEISQISFLLAFRNLDLENVYKLKKMQANSKLSDEQIRKYAQWMKMDMNLVNAFLDFKLTVTGQELMDAGFKGVELGKEMERREKENFAKYL